LARQGGWPVSELLFPPVGLAAVELGLHLADVGREVVLLLCQPRLELVDGLFAPLELLEPELDIRLGARFTRLDVPLALVELGEAGESLLVDLGAAAPLPLHPLPLGPELALLRLHLGLARRERLLADEHRRFDLAQLAFAIRLAAFAFGELVLAVAQR